LKTIDGLHGFSHITGGGIIGNTKRIVPKGLSINVDWEAWTRPSIFHLIQEQGNVPEEDMRDTFNLGIGLIAVVSPDALEQVRNAAVELEETIIEIGEIT
jgi:phosphoribosylformylglycinamidine cyclo-ligase